MDLYSFIHSLNTKFGSSIYEQVAEQIAIDNFTSAKRQHPLQGEFTDEAQREIQSIMNQLTTKEIEPNHVEEIERIRNKTHVGTIVHAKLPRIDLYLTTHDTHYLIEIKTVKPNKGGFEKHKSDMLTWVAALLRQCPDANVRTILALPYNPYAPKPYSRWTLNNILDTKNPSQIMVGAEFWNFLAGGDVIFDRLLDCFQKVGEKMRDEIDRAFERFEVPNSLNTREDD